MQHRNRERKSKTRARSEPFIHRVWPTRFQKWVTIWRMRLFSRNRVTTGVMLLLTRINRDRVGQTPRSPLLCNNRMQVVTRSREKKAHAPYCYPFVEPSWPNSVYKGLCRSHTDRVPSHPGNQGKPGKLVSIFAVRLS